jgi:hypothetical protein
MSSNILELDKLTDVPPDQSTAQFVDRDPAEVLRDG